MGLLEYFSKKNRSARWIAKQVRRANNKHTPKDYRQIALQNVLAHARKGNEDAIRGMVSRFAVVAEPTIEDEREKEWVCEALDAILPQDTYKAELIAVLSDFDTEYERNPDRKIQTIMALAEIEAPEIVGALERFLEDVDETVRFQTVVALTRQGDESAREALLKAMCDDESIRVRNEIVASFARRGWSTAGAKKKVDAILPAGYKQDKGGKIVKLGGAD
jgi:hypothetical protein